jgi:hypothetical protein
MLGGDFRVATSRQSYENTLRATNTLRIRRTMPHTRRAGGVCSGAAGSF